MTLLDLATLQPGYRVQEVLLVIDVMQKGYSGGYFTVLTLSNASGTIDTAPIWDNERELVAGVRKRHAVQVIGEVTQYDGRRQLKVASVRVMPEGTVQPQQLLPSVGDVGRYWETLDAWRREIRKPRLARVLALFYDDDDFRRRYAQCPASIGGHHAKIGGLLKHTTEVAAIARTIARATGGDQELVLAGALLHDIGKLEAYTWDGIFDYAEDHHLLGHVVLGARMLERRLRDSGVDLPPRELAVLTHLILSHHGQLEFGSPVRPLTLEAEILHWADNASAKTASMAEALREAEAFGDGAVAQRRFWQLDNRRPFRGASDWGAD
jgi:3'-5' exoribonuclease